MRKTEKGTLVLAFIRFAAACIVAASSLIPIPAFAEDGDGTVTVQVVREVNANGEWDGTSLEPGLKGVTVNLTDDAGNTISETTDADGLVTIDPAPSALTGGKYRVQVINPKPGILYSAFANHAGLSGGDTSLSSTEEFVDVSGGNDAAMVTAFWNPADYCQKNATLVTACLTNDVDTRRGGDRTLVKFPYNARGNDNQTTDLATKLDTGALYGIGYSKQKKWIFSGASAHRGTDYGPGGSGAIYLTNPDTGANSLFTTVPGTGTTTHDFATDMDLAFAPAVGKEALGDVEVSEDGEDVYTINLNDRKLYRYDATQSSASAPKSVYSIPQPDNPCPDADDWRPYGLGFQDGVLYVGGVCSGESTQDSADLRAVIRTFDPDAGTFGSVIMDQPLNFGRPITDTLGGVCNGDEWNPWVDPIAITNDAGTRCGLRMAHPEPILADIIVDTDGSLILGFRDRFTDQLGIGQRAFAGDGLRNPSSGGALYRACEDSGAFVMDVNGGCGVSGNYYYQQRTGWHQNAFHAGVALSKVETTIASSAMDPNGSTYSGGTAWANRDGTAAGNVGNRFTNSFGKGGSMADLEVLCDEAPIQIGNRVWYDVDKDGIQDPGEDPVPGATVNLYDADGNLVATTTTTERGEYYFDNSNVPGDLQFNTDYTIKIDNPADYEPGGPLYLWVVTQNDAGDNDFIDSDGVVPDGGRYPEHSITTGSAGQDNHTYDFGYHQPDGEVKIVKVGEDGEFLAGAKFQLWKETNGTDGLQMDGDDLDTAIGAECATGDDGVCSSVVELGRYWWVETAAPDGHLLPDPNVFGPLDLTLDNFRDGVVVTATNAPMRGKVTVTKVDENEQPLAGAGFQLWEETNGTDGLQTQGGSPDTKVGDVCTTAADGVCEMTVRLGEYWWEETAAPDGYHLPDPNIFGPLVLTPQNFEDGLTVSVVNDLITGQVRVVKVDHNNQLLAGAEFQLWKETNGTGGLQTDGGDPDTKVGDVCVTDAQGVCEATVPVGEYWWEETVAPDGHHLPDPNIFGPIVVSAEDYSDGKTVDVVNEPIYGTVRVLKVDENEQPLAGVVFQLWHDSNSQASLQRTGSNPDTKMGDECTTGADGICEMRVLLGDYWWEEISAPDGYMLADPAVIGPLTVDESNYLDAGVITAMNKPIEGKVRIIKKDNKGNVLAGAEFQLWKETNGTDGLQTDGGDPDTKVGDVCVTDAQGVCEATVQIGEYYWEETKAPEGYHLPDPNVFGPSTIDEETYEDGVTVEAVNEPIPEPPLPVTSGSGSMVVVWTWMGIIVIAIGAATLYGVKRRKAAGTV